MNLFIYRLYQAANAYRVIGLFGQDRLKADKLFGELTGLRRGNGLAFVDVKGVKRGEYLDQMPCHPENVVEVGLDDKLRIELMPHYWNNDEALLGHPYFDECGENECEICAVRDCPDADPLHYHHDGCPSCTDPGGID